MKILVLQGWQSVPGGVKPTFLVRHGHEVINPKPLDEDFTLAVEIAQEEFDKHQPDVVVGLSRGGAVAMNVNSGVARLVLLCPAWKKSGTAKTVKVGTVILHSWADDVAITQRLLKDREDLIQKAAGWMLREVGEKDQPVLEAFLDRHAAVMPRTMLRYAIERFPPDQRRAYLQRKHTSSEGVADGLR